MWKLFFKKKEKLMPTSTENKNRIQLTEVTETVQQQRKSLSQALSRLSALSDEIASLRTELKRFKNDVANDVKYLTERVDG
jgi:ABC-type transporter Mla subunit MlaD